MSVRLLLVDDQELIRVGFRLVLEAEDDLEVVGEASDGLQAVEQARRHRPDVVLMDVRMPRSDGIRATAEILAEVPQTRVLILTTFDLDEYAFAALEAGASGFLLKDAQRSELVGAVRAIARGDAALAPRVTKQLIARMSPVIPSDENDRAETLTDRERDVFLAMGRGLTNAEIAAALFLGESTVKTHVGRVLSKLGARDRVHAVILAHRYGHVSVADGPEDATPPA
ncbi:response regulator transcription factor [Microbacterium sp.]|uniref:response regulator transcription factor n=1 Tax=Microbacterium sp. TaxID=51671 RepID=UPI003A84A87A